MNISISSVAQEAGNTVGTSKAYSNGRGRKNKCSSSQESSVRARWKKRRNEKGLLCDRCG